MRKGSAKTQSNASSLAAYTAFRKVRFFGSLDGLRAISIIGVIWAHTMVVSPYYSRFIAVPILDMGAFGVEIFFVISGFLITTLLLGEQDKFGTISLREFYVRRTLRIWPLYYATLGLYVLLVLIVDRGTARSPEFFHYLPGYLTFTYTWFALPVAAKPIFNFAWSLSVEEQFYMLWAPVLRFFRRGWPAVLMLVLILVRLSTSTGVIANAGSLLWRIAANISVSICLGALLAHALHWSWSFQTLYPALARKWSAPVALVLLVGSLSGGTKWWLVQSATAFVLVGSCVIREDHGIARFLKVRALAYIGTVSYGMYMFNSLVIDFSHPLLTAIGLRNPVLTFVPYLCLTILVASLSYRYCESPFLALKSKFYRMVPQKTGSVTPGPAVQPRPLASTAGSTSNATAVNIGPQIEGAPASK